MTDSEQAIRSMYTVSPEGKITSPGSFENQPIWVPYFWYKAMNGMEDETISGLHFIRIDSDDIQRFPDLATAGCHADEPDGRFAPYGIVLGTTSRAASEMGVVFGKLLDTKDVYDLIVEGTATTVIKRHTLPPPQTSK